MHLALATLPVAPLMALLVFGIALLLVLILRFKLQAFLALILVSVVIAVASKYVNPEAVGLIEVAGLITDSMGDALGFLALIVGMGAIFGAVLEHSGGVRTLSTSLVRAFGRERAPWAMMLTGFIISIPVFLDVALVMLAPLLYALSRDTGRSLLVFGIPLVAGMAVTHAFVPPTPGPVVVAVLLNVNLGWVILYGLLVGLPTALICGPWITGRLVRDIEVSLPEEDTEAASEPSRSARLPPARPGSLPRPAPSPARLPPPEAASEPSRLPPLGLILLVIALPILLIVGGAIVEQVAASALEGEYTGEGAKERWEEDVKRELGGLAMGWQFVHFLGQPVIALMITTLVSLVFLGACRGASRERLLEIATRSLGPAGIIILITGAGGVFKGVLKGTGIDLALVEAFGNSGIPVLVLAYLFALLVRIAQGSATVAMITAAGLMSGFVGDANQHVLALVTICIAAGATGFSHVNDSGFWIISRYLRMSEGQTLRTWTVVSTLISVVGFLLALALWQCLSIA